MSERRGLGRRVPTDWKHVEKYPFRAVAPTTTPTVERQLDFLTDWRRFYDQNGYGACVGFAVSECMSILNRRRYAALWLWDRAKERDEWSDTNPGDNNGTSGRAAFEVLRDLGHERVVGTRTYAPSVAEGISTFRWATTVDEMRTAIAAGSPVCLGMWWYSKFYEPLRGAGGFYWFPSLDEGFGSEDGGHEICITGASDHYEAFTTPNTWGIGYPKARIPYDTMATLLDQEGDAGIVTDR